MSSRRRIVDPDQFGRDNESMLKNMRAEVFKKLKILSKAVTSLKKVHEQYQILIARHFEDGNYEQSQLVQTGKFQFPSYQLAQMNGMDKISTDISGDYQWRDEWVKYQLNPISCQGYSYTFKEVMSVMQKHDVQFVKRMKKALDDDLVWEQVSQNLQDLDAELKEMSRSIESIGQHVFSTDMAYGQEELQIRMKGNNLKLDRKGHFDRLMTATHCEKLLGAILGGCVLGAGQDEQAAQILQQHEAQLALAAEEEATALALVKKVAAERTAEDLRLREEIRMERQQAKENEVKEQQKKEFNKQRARATLQHAKQLAIESQQKQNQKKSTPVPLIAPESNSSSAAPATASPTAGVPAPLAAPASNSSSAAPATASPTAGVPAPLAAPESNSSSAVPATASPTAGVPAPLAAPESNSSSAAPATASPTAGVPAPLAAPESNSSSAAPATASPTAGVPAPLAAPESNSSSAAPATTSPTAGVSAPLADVSTANTTRTSASMLPVMSRTGRLTKNKRTRTSCFLEGEDELDDSDNDNFHDARLIANHQTSGREKSFIAREGAVVMRRGRHGQMEEDSDFDSEVEEIEKVEEEKVQRSKRLKRDPVHPLYLNTAFAQYLDAVGSRSRDGYFGEDIAAAPDQCDRAVHDELTRLGPEAVEAVGFDGQSLLGAIYDKLNYKEVMSPNSTMSQEKRSLAIDQVFCEVVVNDVCQSILRNVALDQNTAVYWYQKRFVNYLEANEVAVIEKHYWKLFFIDVKEKVMERLTIKPKLLRRPNLGGKPRAPLEIPLTNAEKAKNELRSRTVNLAISKRAKQVIYVYETLNETVQSLDLPAFVGCGYVMPSPTTTMEEVFHSIEIDCDNVLQLVISKEFDHAEYNDFKELILTKTDRNDLKTHADLMEARKAQALAKKEEKAKIAQTVATKAPASVSATPDVLVAVSATPDVSVSSATPDVLVAVSATPDVSVSVSVSALATPKGAEDDKELEAAVLRTPQMESSSSASFPTVFNSAVFSDDDEMQPSRPENTDTPASVPYYKVNYEAVASVLKQLFNNTSGECNGLIVEHNKLKTKPYTNQKYVNDLAHIVTLFLQFRNEDGAFNVEDLQDIVYNSKIDHVMQKLVFIVRKTFLETEVDFACANNTRTDGYCMWWMSMQQKIRAEQGPGMDCEALRNYCATLKVDEDLAPHIQHYLDCVKYQEKESQDLAVAQLTTVLGRARDFPDLENPFNLWGNSKLCRFIDVRVMLFCMQSAKRCEKDGILERVALLSIVNHALGDMYQDGAPQFTYGQMEEMFQIPMYAAFMNSHFFSLENPVAHEEVANMNGAYTAWIHCILERVGRLSDTHLRLITSLDSNNKHHGIIDLVDDSDDEGVDMLIDQEDDVPSSLQPTPARFSGEVSFRHTAPFRDDQRETLFETIRLMQQRILEMETEMGKMKKTAPLVRKSAPQRTSKEE